VAIVKCGSSTFYILAPQPNERPNFSHAILMFKSGQNSAREFKPTATLSSEGSFLLLDYNLLYISMHLFSHYRDCSVISYIIL
jgi:hypothetical protein